MSRPMFFYTTSPEAAEEGAFSAGQWALRKYGFPYSGESAAPSKKNDFAMNPCQAGDEEECAAWLRECLTEAYY